jgi:citrate synthase
MDPRAAILKKLSQQRSAAVNQSEWFEISEIIERVMVAEKNLYPNVDFYSASLYNALGIPKDLFTPMFAASRVAGYAAHIIEQYKDNRLIRPLGNYTGPSELKYIPIDER